MGEPEVLMDRIARMPNSTCFFTSFSSVNLAKETIKRLSYAAVDSVGIRLPGHMECGVFKTTTGAVVIIGGTMSEKERVEIFELFEKFGHIKSIALPKGAEPPQQKTLPAAPTKPEALKPPEAPAAKKYCIYCGFEMRVEGIFCPRCGKKQV